MNNKPTDKELLEKAAKAAFGITATTAIESGWNPLTDDGDALRLAVKLEISVDTSEYLMVGEFAGFGEYEKCTDAWHVNRHTAEIISIKEIHGDDPYAATRRAIVRAAAEIGKTL